MSPTELEYLFKFINEACTNEQVRALLREKKKDGKKVRVGQNSEEVMQNLKTAHGRGVVRDDELIRLLAAGEENGRQHIFFYRVPARAHAKYSDSEQLVKRLRAVFGAAGDKLPHFVLLPERRTVSDIRTQRLANDQSNVVVKWYSGREFEEVVLKEHFQRDGDRYIRRESKIERVRLVSLLRYHPRGLLEVRVPTGERESRKTCLSELEMILELVEPVFRSEDRVELSLQRAMKWLKTHNTKTALHQVSSAQAADGDARAEFNPAIEGQDLFSSLRHRDAIALYEDVAKLDVYWKSPLKKKPKKKLKKIKVNPQPDNNGDDERIRCQMGVYVTNGIRIGAKRASDEIDFVVNRLWDLSK
jgi:hypothetical protein